MSSKNEDAIIKNYGILNTIVPSYYKKKYPYNIIERSNNSNLELTHKNIDLTYIKNKNYFTQKINEKKGGDNYSKILVFII